MAKPRLPQDKAEVSGATLKDPGRFKDRKKPSGTRPVGEPYATMTEPQIGYWNEYKTELPWLNSSHRQLLRLACILSARADDGECGVEAMKALSAMLSKMGATPVDETKVRHDDSGNSDDPADEFFAGPRH
jgi:hypothetical protein